LEIYEQHLLQRVIFGEDTIDRLGNYAQDVSARTVLVVTDKGVRSAGYLDRALASLRKASLEVSVFDEVAENPTTNDIENGVQFARNCTRPDLIVGLGGGSPMDCAKGINFVLTSGAELQDNPGMQSFKEPLIPSIGIPTTAGTGSEAQSYAVIADADTHQKRAYGCQDGRFGTVLLDPKLTLSMPPNVTATCGADAISHALESYVSTRRSPVSKMLAREAWGRLHSGFSRVITNPKDITARRDMLWGAHFAGAAIENSMLGATHAVANPMTARFDLVHGSAIAVMLPHVVDLNAEVSETLYGELVQTVGLSEDCRPAELLSKWLRRTFTRAGLPLRLRDCGINHGALPALAREASDQWTGRFNPRPVGEEDFLRLYEGAF